MNSAAILVAIAIPLLLGWAVSDWRSAPRHAWEFRFVCDGVNGFAMTGIGLVLLGRLSVPLTPAWLILIFTGSATAILLLRRWRVGLGQLRSGVDTRSRTQVVPPQIRLQTLLMLLFIAVHFVCAAGWMFDPHVATDGYENWLLRSKVIATWRGVPLDVQSPYYLGGGRSGYPLAFPMLSAWPGLLGVPWSEATAHTYCVICYLLLGALLVQPYFSRARLPGAELLFIAVLSTPLLLRHVMLIGYADLPLMVHLTAAGLAMWAMQRGEPGRGVSACLNLLFIVLLKREGLLLCFIMLGAWVVAELFRGAKADPPLPPPDTGGADALLPSCTQEGRGAVDSAASRSRSLLQAAMIAVGAVGLASLSDLSFVGREAASFGFRGDALWPIVQRLYTQDTWGLLWWIVTPLLPVAALRLWRDGERLPVLQVGGLLAFLIVVFLFSSNADFAINGWTFDRSVMQVMPLVVACCALGLPPLGAPPEQRAA